MASAKVQTVDEYIGAFPRDVQSALEEIRQTIRNAVPEAEEVISYSIPAYKLHGWVLYFSAFKNHYSISCPPPFTVFDVFEKELSPYAKSKSTVRFPKTDPVPLSLIGDMAKYRATENRSRATGE